MVNNTLTNFEIDEILKKYKIKYNGIFLKDKLPNKLLNGFYIINLQSSYDGNGTHWTALNKINDGYSQYWDSYGFPPPQEVENKLKHYVYNDKDIQHIESSSCGFYCIAWIKFMNKHENNLKKAYDTFTSFFSKDTEKNEEILHTLLYG